MNPDELFPAPREEDAPPSRSRGSKSFNAKLTLLITVGDESGLIGGGEGLDSLVSVVMKWFQSLL